MQYLRSRASVSDRPVSDPSHPPSDSIFDSGTASPGTDIERVDRRFFLCFEEAIPISHPATFARAATHPSAEGSRLEGHIPMRRASIGCVDTRVPIVPANARSGQD
ncbi:hypothetical protein D7S86_22075 [Pararobbsia silviterrae]|uniref:Uncharacterized protein n=1 Tax=Pararobbsia silviterrae TaxID=1792498 RepID=A0A494XD18_9BURK|nr:hypothetical protein D7S86_22075 [Pararobbsia silviterrae]